jgi:hypothetical protein
MEAMKATTNNDRIEILFINIGYTVKTAYITKLGV